MALPPFLVWGLGAAAVYGVGRMFGFWGKKSAWDDATVVVDPKTGKPVQGYVKPKNPDVNTTHMDGSSMSEEEKGAALAKALADDLDGFDEGVKQAKRDHVKRVEYASSPPDGYSKAWLAGWRRGYIAHINNICNFAGRCAHLDTEDGSIDWPGVSAGEND